MRGAVNAAAPFRPVVRRDLAHVLSQYPESLEPFTSLKTGLPSPSSTDRPTVIPRKAFAESSGSQTTPDSRILRMRRVIASEFMTLDGVMQSPGAPDEDTSGGFDLGGWIAHYWDDKMDEMLSAV